MRRLATATVILTLAGCSFAVTGPDPKRPAGEPPRCERTAGGKKLLDVLGGVTATAATYIALREAAPPAMDGCDNGLYECEGGSYLPALGLAIVGIAYWSSLIVGVQRTNSCAAEHAKHRDWMSRRTVGAR